MNIKEAKEQVKNAMTAYFTKNKFGEYVIPTEKQRPVFLLGEPGIGKTAIMEQIASELDVGLVSYSMTHHTRQSAIGLPFIDRKVYDGKEYRVSEYTMSEIIASVYETMERTGKKEGILFLDEINCVSETLSATMLQFLQYKVFGRHRVPDGWIVVTAGNPPEFNNSVRDFDIVTWDRLKKIVVEHDYNAWREYAVNKGTHPAVITYLDIKKQDFYKVESTTDGKRFVTARGWSDLAQMIVVCEERDLPVDAKLVGQYLQDEKIAKSFAIYYDLFKKYRSDYKVDAIYEGKADGTIKKRAANAGFDERISFIGLLLSGLRAKMSSVCAEERSLLNVLTALKTFRENIAGKAPTGFCETLDKIVTEEKEKMEKSKLASSLSDEDKFVTLSTIGILNEQYKKLSMAAPRTSMEAIAIVKQDYDARVKAMKNEADRARKDLDNTFSFLEEVYESDGQEMLIFVTELVVSRDSAHFLGKHRCDKYVEHSNALRLTERRNALTEEIESFDFDDADDD